MTADGYVNLDDDVERAAKGSAPVAPPHSPRPSAVKAHRAFGLPLPLPTLPGENPVLSDAAEAFAADAAHKSPVLDGGDLPLKFLAQGLSMLSIDELRRLRLPAMPWQAGDGGPSMWEGIKKTPWRAHYSNVLGFVISTGALIAHVWASLVASLLVVFVSQACAHPVKHDCHMNETMSNLSFLGRLVVTFNWLSLGANLLAEFVYFRREAWLISHLDDNDAAPYNQLPTFIHEHHKIVEGLRAHNKLARTTAVAVLALCSFNLVISCALLLTPVGSGGRFNGVRTLVGLVSNTLLLARRIVQNARISSLSLREDLGLSLFQMKFRSFNDLGQKRKAELELAKGVHGAHPVEELLAHEAKGARMSSSVSDSELYGKAGGQAVGYGSGTGEADAFACYDADTAGSQHGAQGVPPAARHSRSRSVGGLADVPAHHGGGAALMTAVPMLPPLTQPHPSPARAHAPPPPRPPPPRPPPPPPPPLPFTLRRHAPDSL